jgi:hypothetical protein
MIRTCIPKSPPLGGDFANYNKKTEINFSDGVYVGKIQLPARMCAAWGYRGNAAYLGGIGFPLEEG